MSTSNRQHWSVLMWKQSSWTYSPSASDSSGVSGIGITDPSGKNEVPGISEWESLLWLSSPRLTEPGVPSGKGSTSGWSDGLPAVWDVIGGWRLFPFPKVGSGFSLLGNSVFTTGGVVTGGSAGICELGTKLRNWVPPCGGLIDEVPGPITELSEVIFISSTAESGLTCSGGTLNNLLPMVTQITCVPSWMMTCIGPCQFPLLSPRFLQTITHSPFS